MDQSIGIIGGADGPTSIFLASPFGGFGGFSIAFIIVFALVIAVFVWMLVKSIARGVKNNASPRLTVEAWVVTKRTRVWGDHAHTSYYVTFQVESGDRMELEVQGEEFGLLVEGDKGKLTFQGTRLCGFERM